MTPADVAKVLAKAAAFDQRTVGEFDVMAWHEVIGDLDLVDALAAVTQHHAESTDRLMPAHIRRLVGEIRHNRHRALREAEERRELTAYAQTAGPLTDRREEIQAFVAQVRSALPEGSEEALKPRAKHWEREHRLWRRQQAGEPNPHYDPNQPREEAS